MKIKCSYCGSSYDPDEICCPSCGAPNEAPSENATGVPKTIDELKRFCTAHNMPLQKMRFFIGEDFREPKAFGIFNDERGNFVVYKNKADGSRAIRYEGPDEAYAVNEIFQKLKSEIALRKQADTSAKRSGKKRRKRRSDSVSVVAVGSCILVVLLCTLVVIFDKSPSRGYYRYDDSYYCYDARDWYRYDYMYGGWSPAEYIDEELSSNYGDYISAMNTPTASALTDLRTASIIRSANNTMMTTIGTMITMTMTTPAGITATPTGTATGDLIQCAIVDNYQLIITGFAH